MTAILAFLTFWSQPKQLLATCNPYATADRVTKKLMQERYEQIDAARRYWVCPF